VGWARVSVMIELEMLGPKDADILFRTYSWSIDNSWERLKSFVESQRLKTGVPDYWSDVEHLAQRARAWRKKHGLPTALNSERPA